MIKAAFGKMTFFKTWRGWGAGGQGSRGEQEAGSRGHCCFLSLLKEPS